MESIKRQYRTVVANMAAALLLSLIGSVSRAELISLDPVVTGSIERMDVFSPFTSFTRMNSSNPLGSLDASLPDPIGMVKSSTMERSFLIFDLSAVSFSANAASIEFNLGYARSGGPNLTVTSLALVQAQALSTIPAGFGTYDPTPENEVPYNLLFSGYNAIGSGSVLGTLASSGPLDGSYTVGLNLTALGLINASSGLLGVGLTWSPQADTICDPIMGCFLTGNDTLTFNSAPRLILNSENPNAVPVPASMW